MPDEITITIDGVDVTTSPGKMVLEAAIDAGIYVPYLCYHPGMKPFAACRMCVVAVEGGRGFPASCTLPVQDGMKVQSETAEVRRLRRSVMEMLIAEHPNGCLTCHRVDICGPNDVCLRHVSVNDRCITCPKNERCEFKDTVRYLGMELESPLGYEYRQIPLEVGDPFYDRDYNLCITCGRCVRVCEEVRGDDAICFTDRSGKALVGTSFGTSLLESGCEFCGACLDVCPVGALVEREHKWEKPRRVVRTICPHCPVGCQLNLEISAQERLIRAVPELNSPANRGQACFKGKFGLEFVNSAGRLRHPLIRRSGELVEATWEEALDYIAEQLEHYRDNSFGILTSANSTNEEHYLAQKFARTVMRTNNVDHASNTQPELTFGLERSLGYPAATNPIWELETAACILVVNSNLTEEQNVVGVPIKRAVRKGTRLVVIDPREVELTRYAHLWLRPAPGTELMLLGGILKSLVDQGLERLEWLGQFCEDPATLRFALEALQPEEVSRITRVPAEQIALAARTFGEADNAAIVYALDNIPADLQRDYVHAIADLALLTGNLGKPGAGIYPMRQGANEQGAWDVGAVPTRLPGAQPWRRDAARQAVESLWGCTLPEEQGLALAEMLQAARDGRVKAMFVIGDSANFTNGRLDDGLAALDNLEFLVVQDSFVSRPAQRAQVVLPRATFAEKDGTYTNLERRIQSLQPGLTLRNNQSRPEGWTICEVARRMHAPGFGFASSGEVMEELARLSPIYAGVSYQRLERETALAIRSDPLGAKLGSPQPTQLLYTGREHRGIQWPCTSPDQTGTPILYADGFPAGQASAITPQFREPQPAADPEYPTWLVPGRVLLQRDRETRVERGRHNRILREEVVELNLEDAARWSIADDDPVEITTRDSRWTGRARLNEAIPPGMVASTGLFGQLAVELQASEELDPMSRVPGLDIVPARVARAGG